MRLLILIFSLWALAYARPEMYKEKEDFQFSRSSSDDGTKSGYYGAQRGNMGGNYEKAHNMDSTAQHQMSTLVRQVDGELGAGATTRTGSVFTAGNSKGIYGSGNYDLSNLEGRNFEEGVAYGDSQSQSLMSQSSGYSGSSFAAADNARYSANQLRALGLNSGYIKTGLATQYGQIDNQQAESQYSGTSNYEYGSQGARNYKYYSHGGSQARNEYDQSNANLQSSSNYDDNSKSKIITTPVRFYIRPGTRVTIPVAAQTYDTSQSTLVRDQNTINTETELISNNGQRVNIIKPISNAKHYENSYSYRKEWEKHDNQPVTVIPTENPFPKNSELYEDSQLSQVGGQRYKSEVDSADVQSSNINRAYASRINSGYTSGYSANTKSATSNRLQYQSQLHNSGSNAASNAHTFDTQNSGATTNLNSLVENINSRPKSYQSSYSYHKSWERRGDPYVITPVGGDLNGQMTQRLLAASADQNLFSSNRYGNQYGQVSQSLGNCDLQCHLRKRRSYNVEQYQPQMYQEQFSPQSMNGWLSDSGQQASKWENLEYLGQQTENKWDDLEGLNQHTHSGIEELGQESQSQLDNLEDLGQQTQNKWDNLESLNQHTQSGIEELGQQSQSQLDNLEDLGQQTQNKWDNLETLSQQSESGVEELGQQSQSQMDNLEDLGKQTQNKWDNLETLNQHPQSGIEELGQQSQTQLDNLEDLGQQVQNTWNNLESLNQHFQSVAEEPVQQSQTQLDNLENLGQQTQNTWNNLESVNQHSQNGIAELSQQSQNALDHLEDLGQQTQDQWDKLEQLGQQTQSKWENFENSGQQTQTKWDKEKMTPQTKYQESRSLGEQTGNKKIENLDQQNQNSEDTFDQTIPFHYMHPEHNIWNKIDTFESQPNMESYNVNSNNQHVSFNQDNFRHIEQSQNNWKELRESFNQENLNPWDHIFQEQNPKPITEEKEPTISNSGINLWDTIDKMISESDKKTDNTNNKQYLGSNISNQQWEEKQSANSYYQHSHNFYHQQDFEESKNTLTEKLTDQLPKTNKNIEIESIDHILTISTTEKVRMTEKPKTTISTHQPADIGRGDIGPEEIPPIPVETNDRSNDKEVEDAHKVLNPNKLYKTQEEIESLSLTNFSEDQYNDKLNQEHKTLSVMGLTQQLEQSSTTTKKPRVRYYNSNSDFITHNDQTYPNKYEIPNNNGLLTSERESNYEDAQNTETQITDNIEQQNIEQENIEQQHIEQQNIEQQNIEQQNIEQQNIEQQNFEQTLLDSQQQMSDMQDLTDFSQQIQLPVSENVQKEHYSQSELGYFGKDLQSEQVQKQVFDDNHNSDTLNENEREIHNVNNLESVSKNQDTIVEPVEPTEKPGFWNSVWKKTVSAKDTVVSWFKN